MNVEIKASSIFSKNVKRLSKKYPSLKSDILLLEKELINNPRTGVLIKENIYKIRLAVRSKGQGKSGGMRVVTLVELEVKE